MMPKLGYLGVGIVKETSVPMKNFKVIENNKELFYKDLQIRCPKWKKTIDDLENCEYFVKVEWIKTLPEEKAYWEKVSGLTKIAYLS